MRKIAIKLDHVSKTFDLYHERSFFSKFLRLGKKESFESLKDISLTIFKGDRVGMVGSNGSGKTTLLRIIAGIMTPTSGNVYINEKVASIINVDAGFQLDLTGEQNIILGGMLLGMSKELIEKYHDAIVKFSGIGQFMDIPMSKYSEGMKLRLGFALAVHSQADIYVLDEGTNVGDLNFQQKLSATFAKFRKENKTIINVSHSYDFIQRNSTRILILENGSIIQQGNKDLLRQYYKNLSSKNKI